MEAEWKYYESCAKGLTFEPEEITLVRHPVYPTSLLTVRGRDTVLGFFYLDVPNRDLTTIEENISEERFERDKDALLDIVRIKYGRQHV